MQEGMAELTGCLKVEEELLDESKKVVRAMEQLVQGVASPSEGPNPTAPSAPTPLTLTPRHPNAPSAPTPLTLTPRRRNT
eukprot:4033186-Pyramimonas_sp.AAC.1